MKSKTFAFSLMAATALVTGPVLMSHAVEPAAATAPAAGADAALAEFDALKMPQPDMEKYRSDAAYRKEINKTGVELRQKRAELAKQFVAEYPGHARAGEMFLIDLQSSIRSLEDAAAVAGKIDAFLAAHPETPAKSDLLFNKAVSTVQSGGTYEAGIAAIDAYDQSKPNDPRTIQLKAMALESGTGLSAEARAEAMKKLIADNPDNPVTERLAGKLARAEKIGKPFELAFTDAVSGKEVTIASLKGKVVVVDFWATWCGPCVADMPTMKKIYAEYKDKGVEFVGISLDESEEQGGKTSLIEFVKKNEIGWPQYYQGKSWDGDFSKSWGIDSIPAVFIIDADGNLHSTDAHGKLEKLIPELLAKRDAATKG